MTAMHYLNPSDVKCLVCGEQAGSTGSLGGWVHRWGPVSHGPFEPDRAPDVNVTFWQEDDGFRWITSGPGKQWSEVYPTEIEALIAARKAQVVAED